MSQSPRVDSLSSDVQAYDVAWAALNKLIRAGHSFSGNERHCCYLNLGPGRPFANVSFVSGLDLPDDGRGLALTDWDHDGRLDLWITNRTGPRVRFFRNDLQTDNQFVAIRLEGATANRDAIGARVSLHLTEPAPPLMRTLYAGSGFRSQSSKWLHFGLGAAPGKIERVTVRWPGGAEEHFSGIAAGNHYQLRQGTGQAARWEPPAVDSSLFEPGNDPARPAPARGSRIVLLEPAPLPAHLSFTDTTGAERPLRERFGAPLLLNLWASWCPNCEEEMAAWTEAAPRLRSAGLEVLSICVDEPTADRAADLTRALEVAKERGYPFPVGLANQSLIENLNAMQRAFIGRQTDLPLPSSFLVDATGNLAVIYKGHVVPDQLVADRKVCAAGRDEVMAAAIPFRGKWLRPPGATKPRAVAVKLVESGLVDDAKSYLEQILALYEKPADGESDPEAASQTSELAECLTFLGAIHYDREEFAAAERRYLAALEAGPHKSHPREELVRTYLRLGEPAKAAAQIELLLAANRSDFEKLVQLAGLRGDLDQKDRAAALYREALALKPQDPEANYLLANLLRDAGNSREAVAHYRSALQGDGRAPLAANNLAWIFATHPEAGLRNGPDAVELATRANELTGDRIPPLLGTLAAAHAEAGDFQAALAAIERAIEIASAADKPDLVQRLESKRELYASGKPFRDKALVP